MTEIGYVIQPGEDIPEDVIGVRDSDRDVWDLGALGVWHTADDSGVPTPGNPLRYSPLTVTAVREPEPDEDLTHYRLPGATLTFCGLDPWDDDVSVTERAGSSNCPACRAAADEAEKPVAEPQPADVTRNGEVESCDAPLRDEVHTPFRGLLRQVMAEMGVGRPEDVVRVAQGYVGANKALTREVGQWQRRCNEACAEVERLNRELEDEREYIKRLRATAAVAEVERLREIVGDKHAEIQSQASSFLEATNKLIAEREWAKGERDEALAEVERLTLLTAGLDQAPTMQAQQLLDVIRDYGQANSDVGAGGDEAAQGAADAAALFAVIVKAVTALVPDPRVLSLPEGTVALVGVESGRRYLRRSPFIWEPDEADSTLHGLQQVLEREGSVRVEMAPPREPRTELPCGHLIENNRFETVAGDWVPIVVPPQRAEFGGAATTPLVWCAEGHGWVSLTAEEYAEIAKVDGPLTEVLDEPDGAA